MLDPETIAELRLLDTGNPGLLKRVVTRYLESLPTRTEELEAALLENRCDGVRASAHALKGDSYAVGAGTVGRLAAELELRAKAGDLSDARGRLDAIFHAIADAQTDLFRLMRG